MKFSINQTELQTALNTVQKGVATRSTLPVLSGIYVVAHGDEITFQTTNLELSIQFTCAALVEEEGKAVLPGKLICDIVKNLPDAAIHVTTVDLETTITCDNSSYSIKGLEPQDFPAFPEVATGQQITVPFDVFSSMAKHVCHMVSKDESRAILTGVFITVEDNELRMVATDSYRLACVQREVAQEEDFSVVVSGGFVSELAGLPKSSENIVLALSENQIVVSYRGTVFVNRRIEGKYPNYKQLLPDTCETKVEVDLGALIAAAKRVALLDQSGSPIKITASAATQTVQLSAVAQDVGSAQETIAATVEGNDAEIALNSSYMLDGLNSTKGDTVVLEAQSSMKPGIFKNEADLNFTYLVMPVRLP